MKWCRVLHSNTLLGLGLMLCMFRDVWCFTGRVASPSPSRQPGAPGFHIFDSRRLWIARDLGGATSRYSTVIVSPWGGIGRKQQTFEKTTTGFRRESGVCRAKYMQQRCFSYISYDARYYCPRKWEMSKIIRCVAPCCPIDVTIQATGSS
jgi:hypothetical protein